MIYQRRALPALGGTSPWVRQDMGISFFRLAGRFSMAGVFVLPLQIRLKLLLGKDGDFEVFDEYIC